MVTAGSLHSYTVCTAPGEILPRPTLGKLSETSPNCATVQRSTVATRRSIPRPIARSTIETGTRRSPPRSPFLTNV